MIRKFVSTKEYKEIAKSHDYFIWHFLMENQGSDTILTLFSYFDEFENKPHFLKQFFDMVPSVPYYESLTKDSYDFLLEWGIKQSSLWKPGAGFQPIMLGFKKGIKVVDTSDFRCYCIDSMSQTLLFLDSDLMLSLGVEEEDLK